MSRPLSPVRSAALAQLGGGLIVFLLRLLVPDLFPSLLVAALAQGCCAALIAYRLGAASWWLAIHLAFLPTVVAASRFGIAPDWYLGAFLLLLLVYWRTDRSQVPLYLSNSATAAALARLLPEVPCRVIDLGCGHGGLLRQLARTRPDCEFLGIEHAPLPWLLGFLASRSLPNLSIRYGDFWRQSFAPFDVVYAFLSPAPMPRLMAQARVQMRPGTLLVSNSFAAPSAQAERVVEVADRRATRLYCYRF